MRPIITSLVGVLLILAFAVGLAQGAAPAVKGGKFEVTCKPKPIPDQAIDPIVSPGAVSAHLHTFFGNRGLTSTSTPAQLQTSSSTTCVLPQDTAAP